MTGWPYCLAEIGLYAVFAALAIGMALDARDRWRQLRERTDDTAAHDNAEHDQDDGAEVSAVRRKLEAEHDQGDDAPPPLAS